MNEPGFSVVPARYAKGMMVVRCVEVDGYKTRAMCLCEHLKGRYVHRSRGYVMSPAKVKKLRALFDAGRDASYITGELIEERQG